MSTFIAAYCVVLAGVIAFATRLGVRQRRLQQSIKVLQAKIGVEATLIFPGDRSSSIQSSPKSGAA